MFKRIVRRPLGVLMLVGMALAGGSVVAVQHSIAQSNDVSKFSEYVDATGNIKLPRDYSITFVHLGTYATATKPKGAVDQLHSVYARPQDVTAYRKTGRFSDGAVIVKDVRKVASGRLTTGHATWSTETDIWFVMIKDSQNRFPKNDLWGDGWGWALFSGDEPDKQIATDYKTDCRTCHVPAKADDWIYLRGYPVLKAGR